MKHALKAAALLWLLLAAPAAAAPTVTEFPIPTAGSGAWDITLGPDGNLWFLEKNVQQIARVVPSDPTQMKEFPTKDDQSLVASRWRTGRSGTRSRKGSPALHQATRPLIMSPRVASA
jgi:streptogramin lyase